MQTSSNDIKTMVVAARGLAGLAAAAIVGSWLWGVVARTGAAWGSGRPARAEELLAALAACAALVLVAWLALGLTLGLLARVPGSLGRAAVAVADVVTPRLMRRTAAFVLGVGVVAGLAPGASVAAPPHATVAIVASAEPDAVATPLPDPGFRSLPDPGWVPAAPTVRPQADLSVLSRAPATTPASPAEVVVQRGDTLWSIAARHLGPGASDAEIAKAWPTWFAENRDVVGDDPDVILPGQVLRAPQVVTS
jgi:LysM domain-containing protein